ncbi:MAG: chromate transporter [Synergistaceae bacterium]|nr:chromate transporter [Synergistaceae bacterium]
MNILLVLSSAFAQVGIGAFGGGLCTLPLIEYQLVTKTGWLTTEQFGQVLALSQVTPGPIAINAATFVGFQQSGILGSLIATISLIAAPICLLCIVLFLLQKTTAEKSKKFKLLLRPVVSGLLSLSLIAPLTATVHNGTIAMALFGVGLLLISFVKIFKENPPLLLFLFGIFGIFFL